MSTSRIHPAPVIVLGNQKTGTSAIVGLLSQATGKSVTIDMFQYLQGSFRESLLNKELAFGDFIRQNKFYFSTELIKEPSLTFFYDELRDFFPKAKFIMVMRDPRDNIRSILNRLGIPGNLQELDAASLEKLQPVKRKGWKMMLEGGWPPVAGNNYIENLAYRWNLAGDIYTNNKDNMVLIRYEDFIKDKVGAIANLAREVGLDPVHDITDKVDVQYQPRGDRNVKWLDFFGAENLDRIEAICGDRMKLFGYEPRYQQQDAPKP